MSKPPADTDLAHFLARLIERLDPQHAAADLWGELMAEGAMHWLEHHLEERAA